MHLKSSIVVLIVSDSPNCGVTLVTAPSIVVDTSIVINYDHKHH